jgi:hypothetical protein
LGAANRGRGGRSGPPEAATGRADVNGEPSERAAVWRSWSGRSRVASYRLPDELLEELADRAAALGLPVGLIVTAAIASVLDAPGEAIEALVDRADDARIEGRREVRRGLAGDAQTRSPER